MIIGLTGSLAAGKGVVSEFLKKKGFVYLSHSDELREIARELKIEITRKNLQDLGNKIRKERGLDYITKLLLKKIKEQQYLNVVVDSIRNPAEIDCLEKEKNFFLVSVDAPQELRFKRLVSRARESDPVTWDKFLEVDNRDKGVGEEKHGQGVGKCMARAKHVFINDNEGPLENLYPRLENLYLSLKANVPPMSWDEYFMTFAKVASHKSKDFSTQVGACIVDPEKRVVGLGYNGFPKGCDDTKFPMAREGKFLETKYPYVVHAEPNAILNSTKETTGCKIYVTLFPCNECAKIIIQAGIKEVIYADNKYEGTEIVEASKILFKEAGVKTRKFEN